MKAEELTLSTEEWLNIGENSRKLLMKNSPIKVELDKTLINLSKVQLEFSVKQKELVDKYAEDNGNGGIQTKVPGKDPSNIDDILFKDEEAFHKELEELLATPKTITIYKKEANLEYPYNGVMITLKQYLEFCTDVPAIDCLFLLEYYVTK